MLLSLWLKSSVLTPGTSKESGVAGIPKALSYWLRVIFIETLLTSGTQNTLCVAYSIYCRVRIKISISSFLKPIRKSFTQISGLRIWWHSRKFGHEMNLKSLLYLVLLDWRVPKISLWERFWKSFTFPVPLLL